MPASLWLSAHSQGKTHNVQVSPEFESWSAALALGISIKEWIEIDPLFRSMLLGFYRARETYTAVLDAIRNGAK